MKNIYRGLLKNLVICVIMTMTIVPGIVIAEDINPSPTPSGASNNMTATYSVNNETVDNPNNEIVKSLNKEIINNLNKEYRITVKASPLWTYTGIYVNTGDNIYITASGTWNIGFGPIGPDGKSYSCCDYDQFLILPSLQGELIAFVGPDPYQGNWGNGNFFPRYTGYWAIGSNGQFVSDKSGVLWLGMNDDAVSKNIYDNSGSVSAYVTVNTQSSVIVATPNGGENWLRGTSHDVRWNGVGIGPTVKIKLYKGGVPVAWDLISSTPNDGVWTWPIWSDRPIGSDYKVEIVVCKGTSSGCNTPLTYVSDMSDNNFAVSTKSSITLVSPNGGENWARCTTKRIQWSSIGNPGSNVKIDLLKGGVLNNVITYSTYNNGVFDWVILPTQALGNDYKIRITSTTNSAYTDTSNNNFMINTPKIVFQSATGGGAEIYVMNQDGSGKTRLTYDSHDDGYPIWSPDNKKVIFSSDRTGNWEVFIMNADGSGQYDLTRNPSNDGYATWSPDGKKIVFTSDRDSPIKNVRDIYTMNIDRTNIMRITKDAAEDAHPSWSPDGRKIAFSSDRNGNRDIYIVNPDGSGIVNITRYKTAYDDYPAWSPDGKKIVFASDRDSHSSSRLDIYVMNNDGSNVIRLTNNNYDDRHPSWSQDGKKIVFASERNGNRDIYIMNNDGIGVIRLTNQYGIDQHPAFDH